MSFKDEKHKQFQKDYQEFNGGCGWIVILLAALAVAVVVFLCSCTSTQPSCPTCPPPPAPIVIHDSIPVPGATVYVHDPILELVATTVNVSQDTNWAPYYLTPSGGDDWPAAISIYNKTGSVRLSQGHFKMSQGILAAVLDFNGYQAVGGVIEGVADAQNSVDGEITTIQFTNPQSFGIAVQLGKRLKIRNLYLVGPYYKAGGYGPLGIPALTQLQIDTLPYSGWQDGKTRFTPTSPCAGIVIDPFSDRSNFTDTSGMYPGYSGYYYSGMSKSGSTAIEISGVCIEDFPVGILITAVNQQNGENCQILNCRIDQCASAIAFTQAQAKTNYVTNLMSWGQTHTIFDGVHYGMTHGDGSTCPVVNGCNIAGQTFDIYEITTQSFSASLSHIYTEGVFKLGFSGSQFDRGAGMTLTDPQIDFQNGGPSPDFIHHGGGLQIRGGQIRRYNGGPPAPSRDVINDVGDKIDGTAMSGPPIVAFYEGNTPATKMDNVGLFYPVNPLGQTIDRNDYDSLIQIPDALIRVDRSNFAGYFLTPDTAGIIPGMLLLTQGNDSYDSLCHYCYPYPGPTNFQQPLGVVSRVSSDTVYFNSGLFTLRDSTMHQVYKCFYRHQ